MPPRHRLTWPFTATPIQVTTYLLFVALFSIAFLVFLNATLSLLIRDLLHLHNGLGNAVGTLGFADELLALFACPFWGLLSDRIGTRTVATIGYAIIGISLFVFVQAKRVYPDLLLARLLFSLGGAAATTMVTAILPSLTAERSVPRVIITSDDEDTAADRERDGGAVVGHRTADSGSTVLTDTTITPTSYQSLNGSPSSDPRVKADKSISQIAGIVGMATGTGALVALLIFLPLPAWLQKAGQSEEAALVSSFYIVGSIALLVALGCFTGLRRLPGEEMRSWRALVPSSRHTARSTSNSRANGNGNENENENGAQQSSAGPAAQGTPAVLAGNVASYAQLATLSLRLAVTDPSIFLGCVGGFVARASSVAISTFIPLFINAYFISSGLCPPLDDSPSTFTSLYPSPVSSLNSSRTANTSPAHTLDLHDIKSQCRRAYTLASALTGTAELVALLAAPLFGFADARLWRSNAPLLLAAGAGVLGYALLAATTDPDPKTGGAGIFGVMALVGVGQIGCIVCSLSVLGRGIGGDINSRGVGSDGFRGVNSGGGGGGGGGILSTSNVTQSNSSNTHETQDTTRLNADTNPNETSPLLTPSSNSSPSQPHSSHSYPSDPSNSPNSPNSSPSQPHSPPASSSNPPIPRQALKGTLAGLYSLAGGAGILLLTKLGGHLFDHTAHGAPFFLMALFNGLLFCVGIGCAILGRWGTNMNDSVRARARERGK